MEQIWTIWTRTQDPFAEEIKAICGSFEPTGAPPEAASLDAKGDEFKTQPLSNDGFKMMNQMMSWDDVLEMIL